VTDSGSYCVVRTMAPAAVTAGAHGATSPVSARSSARGAAATLRWTPVAAVKQQPKWCTMTGPHTRTLSPVPVPVTRTGWSTRFSSYVPSPVKEQVVPVATMPLTVRRHASPDRRLVELPVCSVAMPTTGRRSMQCFSDEGFEKPQTTEQPPPSRTADREFLKLLDSLEVRVDLMAQMQHTRNRIQERAKSVEGEPAEDEKHIEGCLGTASTLRQPPDSRVDVPSQDRSDSGGTGSAGGSVESRLLGENEELWSQLRQQHECISRLTGEVQGLRAQLLGLERSPQATSDGGVGSAADATAISSGHVAQGAVAGTGATGCSTEEQLRRQLREALARAEGSEEDARQLRQELCAEMQRKDRDTQDWQHERLRLRSELQELCDGVSTAGGGVASMLTEAVLPVESMPSVTAMRSVAGMMDSTGMVAPFSRQACGANVTLSEDALVATRTRGCRQSVVVGSTPLPRQQLGWYYEVEVCETVDGWVGGLGIGVTRTSPLDLRRVPDKAWRLQNTWIVGYWGCVFLNGKEQRTQWRADALPAGSRVGILVSGDGSGDLRVFVDGILAVCVEAAVPIQTGSENALFPVVDVFAATLKVALRPGASPPEPPWGVAALSPPGSPVGSVGSVPQSMGSW